MLTSPPFVWAVIGLLLVASEMLIPGFTIFFFGAGALLTALLAGIIGPISDSSAAQILLWLGSSLCSFVFLRKQFKKIFRGTVLHRMDQAEGVGEKALVLEDITPERAGRIRYRGTSWKAVSSVESFRVGETVEIVESTGLSFTVTAPFDDDDFIHRLEEE